MDSFIKASQILSSETDLNQLLIKMMELLKSNSGADKIVLLLKEKEYWSVQALDSILIKNNSSLVKHIFDLENIKGDLIPETIFNYFLRSKEELVIENARFDERFAKDNLIQTNKIKSIACIPIMSQGELRAMVYLENRKLENVFNLERMEFLKHLSSQFCVFVENALLFDSLNRRIRELQKSEEQLSLIYDSITDILFYIKVEPDNCFRFLSINQSFMTATGLTRDQIVGKRIEEVIPEPSIRMVLDNYKKAIKEKRIVRWEETSVFPSGEKVGTISIAPVLDEKGISTPLEVIAPDVQNTVWNHLAAVVLSMHFCITLLPF